MSKSLFIQTNSGKSAAFIALFLILLNLNFRIENHGEQIWKVKTDALTIQSADFIKATLQTLTTCQISELE